MTRQARRPSKTSGLHELTAIPGQLGNPEPILHFIRLGFPKTR